MASALRAISLRLPARPSLAIHSRAFSQDKILSEEERAKETMFIRQMEREKLEKAARQRVKPEAPAAETSSFQPGPKPAVETSTDSRGRLATFAGVVTILAAGWWYMRFRKVKEGERSRSSDDGSFE